VRALLLVLGLGSSPALAAAPNVYLPARSDLVVAWKKPSDTLAQAEAFMLRSGLAPQGAQPGFLNAQLQASNPQLALIDLSKPIWIGMWLDDAEQPQGVAVASLAPGQTKAKLTKALPEASFAVVGRRVVLRSPGLPASFGRPQAQPFRFRVPSAKALRASSNLVVHATQSGLRKGLTRLAQASSTPNPGVSWLQQMDAISVALDLDSESALLRFGMLAKKASELAKSFAATPNREPPLIRGLPPGPFAVVGGGALSPTGLRTLDSTIESLASTADDEDPRFGAWLRKHGPELMAMSQRWSKAAKSQSWGLALPNGLSSMRVHAVMLGNAKQITASMDELPTWAKAALADAEQGSEEPVPFKVDTVPSRKVAGARLQGWSLDLLEAPPELADSPYASMLAQPVLYGPVSTRAALLVWNTPDDELPRSVQAARAGRPYENQRVKPVSNRLPTPRTFEAYVDVATIAGAALTEANPVLGRTLAAGLSSVPPVGLSSSRVAARDIRVDMVVPLGLAEIVGALASFSQ
jgi:hypothetical protein